MAFAISGCGSPVGRPMPDATLVHAIHAEVTELP